MTIPEQHIFEFKPIKGCAQLNWRGKQPYTSTKYFPAQCKECIGEEQGGWINRLYWGDNLRVMSHLMKEFRGKIDLIYIDPPFDSKAEYKRRITIRGNETESALSAFEDKQYSDIWSNDEYLQFMYERLILMRELLSGKGSIYIHLDEKRVHYIRLILDEVFGKNKFRREIIWDITVLSGFKVQAQNWIRGHDTILYYSKSKTPVFNKQRQPHQKKYLEMFNRIDKNGEPYFVAHGTTRYLKDIIDKGKPFGDVWDDIMSFQQQPTAAENCGYPTQKPESLLARIIKASSNPGGIVFDCFMGSGTTQAVAMKLGRRFIGADINVGAIQTTIKRLSKIKKKIDALPETSEKKYTSFKIFSVNNNEPKCKAEADVQRKGNKLIINSFYPLNLMRKFSLERTAVNDWKKLVDSIMIDFNYNQAEMRPAIIDISGKNEFVKGEYDIPKNAGRIKVKITDLISESFETELE